MTTTYIGQPASRVDAHAKVTGEAKYAAEYNFPNLAHGFVVSSTIARGRITRIDTADALRLLGVLQVLTHENAPRLARSDSTYVDEVGPPGSAFRPLQDNEIRFNFQPVALVVADTFELARYAATLVRVEYEREAHVTDLNASRPKAYVPRRWEVLPPVQNRAATPRMLWPTPLPGSTPSIASRSSITTRWSCSGPRLSGKQTASSPCTTRPRGC